MEQCEGHLLRSLGKLFLSQLCPFRACLTDAYELIAHICPVLQVVHDMLACSKFSSLPTTGIHFPPW